VRWFPQRSINIVDSCYHFHGSPVMAGILRLSVLLYQELLIRIRLNLPSDMRSNNIGFLRYITPLLSRRLSSRFIRFAFPNSVQTRHMEALLLRPFGDSLPKKYWRYSFAVFLSWWNLTFVTKSFNLTVISIFTGSPPHYQPRPIKDRGGFEPQRFRTAY
jgi:hypothetical protein